MKKLDLIKKEIDKNILAGLPFSDSIQISFQSLIESEVLKENEILPVENDIISFLDIGHITVRKVLHKLEELGYIIRKKRVGVVIKKRYLYRKKGVCRRLGLVYYSKDNFFYECEYLKKLLNSLFIRSLDSNIEVVPIQCFSEFDCEELVKSKNVDGVLIFPNKTFEYYKSLDESPIFKMILESELPKAGYDCVFANPRKGYDEACLQLVNQGFDRFGFLIGLVQDGKDASSENLFVPTNAVMRLRLFEKCLSDLGIAFESDSVYQSNYEQIDINKLVKTIYKSNKMPSAFFAYDDSMASLLIEGLSELGLNVPEDIVVIGYGGNSDYLVNSPISTIMPEWDIMAQEIINRFSKKINFPHLEDTILKIESRFHK